MAGRVSVSAGVPGYVTVLDAGDDTDNSANDFAFATPAPRNNAGAMGTIPPATCGERYRKAVVWDAVGDVLAASATGALASISNGGQLTASAISVQGVAVPAG